MSQTTRGLAWIVAAGLSFVVFLVAIRYVGSTLHPVQSAFLRYAIGLLFLMPVLARRGSSLLHTRRLGRHALRGVVHAAAVLLWFYAITVMPIAAATALSYTSPIFVTLGALLILGERYAFGRVAAVVIGLVGVMVSLRPGLAPVGTGAIAILLSAPLFAASKLLAKSLLGEDDVVTTVIYLSIFATATMLLPAVAVWETPGPRELALVTFAALFATVSHYALARGLKLVDVTVAQPAEFLMLVWATLFGVFLFDESPSLWVWVGGAVIVFGVWIASRDDRRAPGIP